MTITMATRRCAACPELLDEGAQVCPSCGRAVAPAVSEWPDGARKFLLLMVVVDAIATKIGATEQQQLEWLLENAMRGRYYEGRLVSYAASAADCFPEFLILRDKWIAAGSPTDFATIAQLRGPRR